MSLADVSKRGDLFEIGAGHGYGSRSDTSPGLHTLKPVTHLSFVSTGCPLPRTMPYFRHYVVVT